MSFQAFLGLGSNVGNPVQNLREALKLLDKDENISVNRVSSCYKTEPVGYEEQPWFFNAVCKIVTEYNPEQLLNRILGVEDELGRVRTIRWGPRIVDLDLLLFEDMVISSERLIVPHPRMLERDFVLIPLQEIAPQMVLPQGNKLSEAEKQLKLNKKVILSSEKLW